MAITAQLFDGTTLEFPDDTDSSVIERVAKEQTLARQQKDTPSQAPKERTWGEAFTDPLFGAVSTIGGIAQLPGQIGTLAGVVDREEKPTGLQGIGKGIEDWAKSQQSQGLKQKQENLNRQSEQAEAEAGGGIKGAAMSFGTSLRGVLTDAALLTTFLGETIPNVIVGAGTGLIARSAAKNLFGVASKQALTKIGVGSDVAANVAMQGADIGYDTYEDAFKRLIEQGKTEPEANKLALTAGRQAAIMAGGISAMTMLGVPGGTALENSIFGGVNKGFLRGVAGETTQEFLEESGGKLVSNYALKNLFPEQDIFSGVGQAGAYGAIGGLGMGAAAGAIGRNQPTQQTQQTQPNIIPPAGQGNYEIPPESPASTMFMPGVPQPNAGVSQPPMSAADVRLYKQQAAADKFGLNMPEGITPATMEEREARQLAAQQGIDAYRFKQQTPRPGVTPSQTPLRTPTSPLDQEEMRQKIDLQSKILGRASKENFPTERSTRLASEAADEVAGTGIVRGAPKARVVDNNPMPPVVARQRLAMIKHDVEAQGGDASNFFIVPHPTMSGRFAIEERGLNPDFEPMQEAPELPLAQVQNRIESSALQGSEQSRLAEDNPRQDMISRAMQNIEQRGGVASPYEAELLREANMGQPFNSIDQGIPPPSGSLQGTRQEQSEKAFQAELAAEREKIRQQGPNQPGQRTPTVESPEAIEAERQARNKSDMAQQQRRLLELQQQRQEEQQSREEAGAAQASKPTEIPSTSAVVGAFQTPAPFRSAEQSNLINQARKLFSPVDFSTMQRAGEAPATMSMQDKARLNVIREGRASLKPEDQVATPEAKETVDEIRKKLLPMLRRFGLEKVGLRLVDSIENGTADGFYFKKLITLALDSDSPMGVMRHEVIHALRELGAFTAGEWKVLSNMADKQWINQFFNQDMINRYQEIYLQENGDLDGFAEYIQEEAIAQAFRYYSEKKPPSGLIANLMRRLNKMFEAIGGFFSSKGFKSGEDVFLAERILADIERGAITPGRAGVQSAAQPTYSMRFSLSGDPTPLSVQGIRIYNKEIENLTKMIGGRIAGMTSEQTVADVRKAIKKLQSFTAKGLKGREWYEQSAQAILGAFNGDKVLAEKLFQIIAITSAATEVSANFTKTVNAWNQFANGRPIKVGTGDTNKKIEALLYFGVDWEGRKTNTFYTNLLEAMEGKDTGRSTIDLHMTRMIFGKDQPTDAQYELAENMVRLLASKMNVPPRQVQAASWVTQKAKGMFEDYRKRGLKKNLNDKELREYAFERAVTDYSHLMKAKVTSLPITPELNEPSPSIRSRTQVITGEVIPSVKTEMSQMEEMSFPQKDKFTKDAMRSGTINKIADLLGIKSRIRVTVGSGGYEGKVNPNLMVQVINSNPAESESDAHKLAFAMSYVFKQDATPFFRADPNLLNVNNFGLQFKFNKDLTPAAQKKILDVMNKYLGADAGFTKVASNEIVMINYRGEDSTPFLMSDADFVQAMGKVQEDVNKFVPIEASSAFGAKSEYPYHDWEKDAAGAAIVEWFQNSGAGRPNLQKSLDNLRESFIVTARDAVTKSGATPRFSLRGARPDQSALRPSDSGGRGISFNDRKEGAVSYSGSHYGKVKTDTLTAISYGSGLRGAEARRLSESDDPRIKRRVYFYISKPNGTMPNIESGLGSHVYTQKLDNILGPGPAMSALFKQAGGNSNAFESLVVDNGYDGYSNPDYGMMVVLNHDVPVNYEGTVNDVHGGAKFSLRQQGTAKFKQWFGNSKITNPNGTPKVMYHGTARLIDEFIPKQANAIFVTDNPDFAKSFGRMSEEFMAMELANFIGETYAQSTPEEKFVVLKGAYASGVKQKAISKAGAKETLDKIKERGATEEDFNNAKEFIIQRSKDFLESRAHIMPLYVRAENPFDYESPSNVNKVIDELKKHQYETGTSSAQDDKFYIEKGVWEIIEMPYVQEAIRNAGFDGFYVKEGDEKNLAVYNPNQVKSATGNNGEFSRDDNNVRYTLKPLTKLGAPDTTTMQDISNTATTVSKAFTDAPTRTSIRGALVDKYSGWSQALKNKSRFENGELRADMLMHSNAQSINLITNGLHYGTPVVNDDGTLGIEKSENNLVRARFLADQADTNPTVVASGQSGRWVIGEIARILRGEDILREDAATNALGRNQIADANRLDDELKKALTLQGGIYKGGKLSPETIAKAYNDIKTLRQQGEKNMDVKRELEVTPEHIAWAKDTLAKVPEAQEVLDIWKAVNTGLVNLYEKVGMLDKETADKYRANKNYVPLFKAKEDLNEDGSIGFTGIGVKRPPKMFKLKGAEMQRNIWENIDQQFGAMTAAAYENQTRRVAVEQLRGLNPNEAQKVKEGEGNLVYREDGKDVHVNLQDPSLLTAFQTMSYAINPVMKFFTVTSQLLRAGALLNPMFWLKQLIRDSFSSTITGREIVTPLHSAKEFVALLANRSEEGRLLASRGVYGAIDNTMTLQQYIGDLGKERKDPSWLGRALNKALEIHEKSDAATRVAIFRKAKQRGLKEGMSEAQAIDYAVYQAREAINFSIHGASPTLNYVRHMIPFMSATINGLDVLYRAMSGYGLNAEEKSKVQKVFAARAMTLFFMSTMYAIMYAGDDEYDKVPDYIKDSNYLMPVMNEDGKKTFLKIPAPYEIGFLFKTLPELLVRYMSGSSSGKEVLASMKAGFIQNIPTGGTPIPQGVKPILEVMTNHSFFTSRPLEGISAQRLPVSERGDKASEFAKMLSGLGLDKINLSPAKIDALTKGYFAEFGTFANEIIDSLIMTSSGKEKPSRNFQNMPFFKSFVTDPNVDQAVSSFYEIEHSATEVANLFSKYKNQGDIEGLNKIVNDKEQMEQVAGAKVLTKIQKQMTKLNNVKKMIEADQSMSPEARRIESDGIQALINQTARMGVKLSDQIGIR